MLVKVQLNDRTHERLREGRTLSLSLTNWAFDIEVNIAVEAQVQNLSVLLLTPTRTLIFNSDATSSF